MVDFPTVGFVGWNPFQFLHVKELAKAIPGSVFIIEKGKIILKIFHVTYCITQMFR